MVDLQELALMAFDVAKGIISKGNEAMPVFLAVGPERDLDIICAPWSDDNEKAATFRAMRLMFAQKKVQAYMFVSEVWVVKYGKDESRDENLMPRDDPRRVECLLLSGHTMDGDCYHAAIEIERRADGSRALKGVPVNQWAAGGSMSGQAVNLLSPIGEAEARTIN